LQPPSARTAAEMAAPLGSPQENALALTVPPAGAGAKADDGVDAAPVPPGQWQPPAALAAVVGAPGVEVSYREEMTHDHYTVPMWQTAFDPRVYMGKPLGRYGVTAFATVSITRGDQVLGDYTAKVHVERNYGMYYGPTYMQLEREARGEVRKRLDDELLRDRTKLLGALNSSAPPQLPDTE
jgi:hypothetical protein